MRARTIGAWCCPTPDAGANHCDVRPSHAGRARVPLVRDAVPRGTRARTVAEIRLWAGARPSPAARRHPLPRERGERPSPSLSGSPWERVDMAEIADVV